MNPEADEIAKVIAEEKIKVVTTGAGNPAKYMDMWKEAGIKVIPVVASRLSVLMRFPRSDSICGRSHDDTPDSGSSELVIKDIPRAACLVTAYRE